MNIKQIAKKAGVSVATVSRVLNHPENVAPATREKIQKIMEQEEYTPNWFAQGLNFNRTKTIGLLIPQTMNSSNMEIANGIEEVARQKGYITFICNMEKDAQIEKNYIDHLIARKVDGLILMYSSLNDEYMDIINEEKIPTVLIGENEKRQNWDSVIVDCRDGAVKMVAHLIECGHKSIGMLCGSDPEQESKAILQGYTNVLKASGIKLSPDYIVNVENTIQGGYIGTKRMIETMTSQDSGIPGDKVDAIFATSDEIAYGAMDAIKDSGLRIPEDIAVAGFGNNKMSNLVEPKLTTVDEPYRLVGIYGARILFDLIEEKAAKGDNRKRHTPEHIILKTKMRIRKSCGHKERIGEMF
ncbi:MAG: LacI family DNA-binding transcriptional regulator [Bacillota bacterium]|nr:LacI family DNA-binding transcriptional regulator [Bacillota bacterium]